jgi:molybdenum cofactor synthesis domain-containing protein
VHVEIVVGGRELLRGKARDDIGPHLAALLSERGAIVHRICVVDDRERAIGSAVTEALQRGAAFIITTGGLGPTADDVTLQAVADAVRLPLALHPPARSMVEAAYRRLHSAGATFTTGLTPAREKMATIPVGSEPIPNERGTAPGVLIRLPGGAAVLCLPGVPDEARSVFGSALERLKDLLPRSVSAERDVEAPTSDESSLRPILDRLVEEFPTVWIKTHAPGFARRGAKVRVTLQACAPTREEAESAVESALRRLLALAGAG